MPTRRSLAALVLCACLPAAVQAADPPYLSDLPKRYPKAYALWGASLPEHLSPTGWIRRLDGVVSPVRPVTIDRQSWRFGTVCVPHDCGGNILGLLFSPQQDRVAAVAQLTGRNGATTVMAVGAMDARTMGCIRYFTDHADAADCP